LEIGHGAASIDGSLGGDSGRQFLSADYERDKDSQPISARQSGSKRGSRIFRIPLYVQSLTHKAEFVAVARFLE